VASGLRLASMGAWYAVAASLKAIRRGREWADAGELPGRWGGVRISDVLPRFLWRAVSGGGVTRHLGGGGRRATLLFLAAAAFWRYLKFSVTRGRGEAYHSVLRPPAATCPLPVLL